MGINSSIQRRDFLRGAMALAGGASGGLLGATGALAQAAASDTLRPISIVNAVGTTASTLEVLIERQGYLKEFGVKASFVDVSDSTKIIASVISGQVDLCMGVGLASVLPALAKGAQLKILGGAWMLAPDSLASSKPNVTKIEDLVGKTIGTGAIGAILHLMTVATLRKHGIDPASVKFVNVGSTEDILKAVVAGTVDAGTVFFDVYALKDKYHIHSVANFWTELPDLPFQGLFASTATIAAKRDAIVRTLAAYAKLYRFISSPDSKDEFVSAYVAGTNASPDSGTQQWQFIRDSQCYDVNLTVSEKQLDTLQQLNMQMHVQSKVLPYADISDMSLAGDALKMLHA